MTRAYGLGPLPGVSLIDAADMVVSETGGLPHLPQLPARGLGADAVGRTASLLEWIYVDRGPRGWVMSQRPQPQGRAARELLDRDLDVCQATWGSLAEVKVQVLGPWSLAARLELANGHRVLTDRGALRDLTDALVEGIESHVRDVERRFSAAVTVQVDEPDLPAVMGGRLKGTTAFDEIRAVHAEDVGARLSWVLGSGRVLNMSGYAPLWDVAIRSGAEGIQVNVAQINGRAQLDGLGEALSAGRLLGMGVPVADPRATAAELGRLFEELGVDPGLLSTRVDVFPASDLGRGKLVDAARAYAGAAAVASAVESDFGDQ